MKECFECGTTDDLQEHHVVPRLRGGTKTVTLCYSCHMKAHGRDSKGLQHGRLTKEALQVAKSRGVKLGTHNPKVLAGVKRRRAMETNILLERVEPIIIRARNEGCRTIQSFCDYLNNQEVKTSRGKDWTTGTMHRVLKKILENK